MTQTYPYVLTPSVVQHQGRWQGRRLRKDEYVISSDEKPSIQARCRCHPTLARASIASCASSTSTTAAKR